jgi:hypothetical protein
VFVGSAKFKTIKQWSKLQAMPQLQVAPLDHRILPVCRCHQNQARIRRWCTCYRRWSGPVCHRPWCCHCRWCLTLGAVVVIVVIGQVGENEHWLLLRPSRVFLVVSSYGHCRLHACVLGVISSFVLLFWTGVGEGEHRLLLSKALLLLSYSVTMYSWFPCRRSWCYLCGVWCCRRYWCCCSRGRQVFCKENLI